MKKKESKGFEPLTEFQFQQNNNENLSKGFSFSFTQNSDVKTFDFVPKETEINYYDRQFSFNKKISVDNFTPTISEKKEKTTSPLNGRKKKTSPYKQTKVSNSPQKKQQDFEISNLFSNFNIEEDEKYDIKDKEKLIEIIKNQPNWIHFNHLKIEDSLKKDEDFFKRISYNDYNHLKYADESLLKNDDFMKEIIVDNNKAFKMAHPDLQNNKNFIIDLIMNYALKFAEIPKNLKNDEEIVRKSIIYEAISFKNIPWNLKKNQNFLLSLPELNFCFEHFDEDLKKDKEFVLKSIAINPIRTIQQCDKLLFEDEDIIEGIFNKIKETKNDDIIEFAPKKLKSEKKYALKAVQANGNCLKHLKHFCSDKDIVLAAVKNFGASFRFADEIFVTDEEIAFAAVSSGCKLTDFKLSVRKNPNFVLQAVKNGEISSIFHLNQALIDKELALKLVSANGCALRELYAYKNDKDVVLAAVASNYHSMRSVDKNLSKDKEFLMEVLDINPLSFEYFDTDCRSDKEIALKAVSLNPLMVNFVHGKISI